MSEATIKSLGRPGNEASRCSRLHLPAKFEPLGQVSNTFHQQLQSSMGVDFTTEEMGGNSGYKIKCWGVGGREESWGRPIATVATMCRCSAILPTIQFAYVSFCLEVRDRVRVRIRVKVRVRC